MAALVASLNANFLENSPAVRAFRPWWDNFEEKLIFALFSMGKIINHKQKTYNTVNCKKKKRNPFHGQNYSISK